MAPEQGPYIISVYSLADPSCLSALSAGPVFPNLFDTESEPEKVVGLNDKMADGDTQPTTEQDSNDSQIAVLPDNRINDLKRMCQLWVDVLKKEEIKRCLRKYKQDTEGNVEELRRRLVAYICEGQGDMILPGESEETLEPSATEAESRTLEDFPDGQAVEQPGQGDRPFVRERYQPSREGYPPSNMREHIPSLSGETLTSNDRVHSQWTDIPTRNPIGQPDGRRPFLPINEARRVHWRDDRSPLASPPYRNFADPVTFYPGQSRVPQPPQVFAEPRNIFNEVRKWGLRFNGQTDPVSFLERLEELLTYTDIPCDSLIVALPELLQGPALAWYRNNKQTWESWDDFLDCFKQFYLPSDFLFHLEEQIAGRKQRPRERGRDYVLEMQTLIRRHGNISPTMALKRIYRNLLPEYRQFIRLSDFHSVGGLVGRIEEYEVLAKELEQRGNRSVNPRNMAGNTGNEAYRRATDDRSNVGRNESAPIANTRTTVNNEVRATRRQLECWNCGNIGHTRNECQNPRRIFCSRCRRPGVLSRDCPCSNSENERGAVLTRGQRSANQ